ncbi:CoA-binding protein [Granulicella cerasi]|uniref:CoA-binding protein n=1 Tax=Granulicella cerasi TaxID=741063 RepID=A0ABW1Z798_9BACT|nr:CoA-binding protein [Granulicella cerasi]
MNSPDDIKLMLGHPPAEPRTLAVIGLSADPMKPSHSVSAYMQRNGYRILPVNPAALLEAPNATILGEPVYASLADLPVKPDVVNVFRLPKFIPAIVDEMIALGLPNLWVQLRLRHDEAAARAEAAGIRVVMDRCILIEHSRLGL